MVKRLQNMRAEFAPPASERLEYWLGRPCGARWAHRLLHLGEGPDLRRTAGLVIAFLALAGVAGGWQRSSLPQAERNLAPAFSVRTLDGRTLKLSDLKGHVVVLDFWATWCGPCRASMPNLSVLQERYGPNGLVVIGLSVDEGDPRLVKRFADRLKVRFPVAMADEQLLDDYGPIRAIPTTIFIGRNGRILRRVVGYVDEETLEGFVKEML